MKEYCLVCESEQIFDNSNDEDCLRCVNCLSLPYTREDAITLGHRKEWRNK